MFYDELADGHVNADGLYLFSDVEVRDGLDYYDGNFGYRDASGNVVIPPQYPYASRFANGVAVVCTKRLQSKDGDPYYFEFNYIDTSGHLLFEKGFAAAHCFNAYGVAAVWEGNGSDMYLIDKTGQEIPGTRFRHIGEYSQPEDRFYEFHTAEEFEEYWDPPIGLYDTKQRKIVFEEKYSDIEVLSEHEFYLCEYTGKNQFETNGIFLNEFGEPLYPQQVGKGFSGVSCPNAEGFSVVSFEDYVRLPDTAISWTPIDDLKFERVYRYGVINERGDFVIPAYYSDIRPAGIDAYTFLCTPFHSKEPLSVTIPPSCR